MTASPRAVAPAATENADAVAAARDLPLDTIFTLGREITPVQHAFLDRHGFLHFRGVASAEEVAAIGAEADRVAAEHLATGRRSVNGVPLFWGRGVGGAPLVQRMPFTTLFSEVIRDFVTDERFEPLRRLVGDDARIAYDEKDGVVVNTYINTPGSVYPRLGWHTDGLRDLFYGRMPQQMLNVGLHFQRITARDGGLRLIPGTHKQGFSQMAFRKAYFVSHAPDPDEIVVETEPGDLTVHDGRLWHRVQRSADRGSASIRRSMYLPYMTGPYEPKDELSPMPGYHGIGRFARALRDLPWKLGLKS